MRKNEFPMFHKFTSMWGHFIQALPLVLVLILVTAIGVFAATGTTDSSAAPGSTNSFTLEGIYNRLNTGSAGLPSAFSEPSVAPGTGTMHTINDIMAIAPVVVISNPAYPNNVTHGLAYWSLASGTWGPQNGQLYGGCTCSGTLNGTRWCDNGDGTVTDLLGYSGEGKCLVWLKNANCNSLSWDWAVINGSRLSHGTCDLNDNSGAGEWWLPTLSQLYGLTHGMEAVRSSTPRAFSGVQGERYWSLTTSGGLVNLASYVDLSTGENSDIDKTTFYNIWPVRNGQ